MTTKDVTILAYHYWDADVYDIAFKDIAHALEEAWRFCGFLKSVLVVNTVRPSLEHFIEDHPNLDVQIEPSLQPGCIFSLSNDCSSRLHTRFETPYVLIVQNDGWPLRSGIEDFLSGEWDFIGAPHVRDKWWLRLASQILNFHPMNGGFSLRSRECCSQVAYWWNKKYHHILGDCLMSSEDIFCTHFLPQKEPAFRRAMHFPDVQTALSFSYQKMEQYSRDELPFGFHGKESFLELVRCGLIEGSRHDLVKIN